MAEKTPEFTVTDRRKFTLEGERREGDAPETNETQAAAPAESSPAPSPAPVPTTGRVVSMPRREGMAAEPVAPPAVEADVDAEVEAPRLTAQETAEQHAAYQQSSRHLDDLLKQANPGMEAAGPVSFEHVVQSIYLSAMIAMGAGTEPGQQPRIDILGARQSVDMLGVLQEKTKGNLNEREQHLLQNALFELRMMFLEITNAIAQSAQRPPQGRG
jgi:Domain of unknown function (DUF1844)